MALILYDLAGADVARRFSPYCWRVPLAMEHKGLECLIDSKSPATHPATTTDSSKITRVTFRSAPGIDNVSWISEPAIPLFMVQRCCLY